ncbi:MAG TPA: PH domain-containing protein [Pyrinomonadaceae bacterium]|nr:PH domain-containing protein [Pyrinomonadaceae bacterium]
MRCPECGAQLDPNSRFCNHCGAATHDPEETRIARQSSSVPTRYADDDVESVIFSARPTMLFIKIGYASAVIGAILITILLAVISARGWLPDIPWYISLPVALSLLLIPAYYHLKRNMVRYTLTDSKIEIDYGLIARTTRNIPLAKIQDVTVSASIPQRILGFGDVVVDNASEIGGTTTLHNINSPRHYADLILRQLRQWH